MTNYSCFLDNVPKIFVSVSQTSERMDRGAPTVPSDRSLYRDRMNSPVDARLHDHFTSGFQVPGQRPMVCLQVLGPGIKPRRFCGRSGRLSHPNRPR